MPLFTVISDIGISEGYVHLTQHDTRTPEHSVSLHLGQLPTDLADDEFNDFVSGFLNPQAITLHPLPHRHVWAWLAAAQHSPRIGTYVIQTA